MESERGIMAAKLTRELILNVAAVESTLVPVEIPEFGGTVYVRAMTAGERGRLEELVSKLGTRKTRAIVAACCAHGEDGKRLFSEGDIETLDKLPSIALDRILRVANELNLITADAREDAGKNS